MHINRRKPHLAKATSKLRVSSLVKHLWCNTKLHFLSVAFVMHFELPSHIPNLAYLAKYNGKVDLTTSSILGCLSDAYELRKSLSL